MPGCDADGERVPHYDPAEPVWECSKPFGGTFMWHWKTHCYGSPPGSCGRELLPYEHTLCRACGDRQYHQDEENKRLEKRRAIMTCAIEEGALPRWFKKWQKPALTQSQMMALEQINNNPKSCVWIQGLKGRGKTGLACTVIDSYLHMCRTVALTDGAMIAESRRNRTLYNNYTSCDLLVMDDIDKGNLSAWNVAQIHAILNERHNARLRTIVTSEIGIEEVTRLFRDLSTEPHSGSTLDRLRFPQHPCVFIELTGSNLRRSV